MKNILVVNNDVDTMSLIQTWLHKKGYQVSYTENADEAVEKITIENPDLVILDVLQKDVLQKVEKKIQEKTFQVLMMTGYSDGFNVDDTNMVDDIIEKPFNLQSFEQKVKALVR